MLLLMCMYVKLVLKQLKPEMSRGMPILAIHSLTRSLQSTEKRGFQQEIDRQNSHGHPGF